MTRQEIEQVLKQYVEAKNSHDVDGILRLCTDDCYYQNVALEGRFQGHGELRDFYAALFGSLPDYWGRFEGVAYGGDSSVSWGRFGGTLADQLFGVPVEPGRKLEIPVTFVCTFRDGRLSGDRGYYDMATVCRQAGIPLAAFGLDQAAADAAGFVAGFERLWATRDPAVVPELVSEDALMHWPGMDPIPGAEYPAHIERMLALCPDLDLRVTAHASRGDLVFISWEAAGTVAGSQLSWSGIDRFRLRGERAVEGLVAYDPEPLREALTAAAGGTVAA